MDKQVLIGGDGHPVSVRRHLNPRKFTIFVNTVISPKRDFTSEQTPENPENDFLNTEGEIISFT
jgi:hypothetical protein